MATTSNREGRVKTWKVLRDNTKIGDSVRDFGDFLPEAPTLETFRSLLRADLIEEIWVDQEEFDEWEQDQQERDETRLAGLSVDEDDEIDEDAEEDLSETAPPRRKVSAKKKTVAKKKTAKKTVKKGKTRGKLEERSV